MNVLRVLRASVLLLVCGIVVSSQEAAAQTDPTVGTWVLERRQIQSTIQVLHRRAQP